MKTFMMKPKSFVSPWYIVDVEGKILGRIATQIAASLRGKHSPLFAPHMLMGPSLIIINASKIKVTGNKAKSKVYEHYTGFPGGLKSESFEKLLARVPTRILEKAVKGMLPKNPLGRAAFRRLKVYANEEHPHLAQHPQVINFD